MLIEFTKYWYRRVGWKLVSVVRRKKFLLKLELWLQVIYFTCSWIWPRGILLTKHTIMRFIMSYTIGFPEPQSRSIEYKTNHSFIVLISNHKKFLVPVILKSIVFLYSWFTTYRYVRTSFHWRGNRSLRIFPTAFTHNKFVPAIYIVFNITKQLNIT